MTDYTSEVSDTWTGEPPDRLVYDGIERPPRAEDRIRRDAKGRPYVRVRDTDGTILAAETRYTRVTTFIKCVDDPHRLYLWKERKTAEGFAMDPDAFLGEIMQHLDDKRQMERVCTEARTRAGADSARTKGSATHSLTEQNDLGWPLRVVPPKYAADLRAWRDATSHFRWHRIETPMINDELKTFGTPDRVGEYHACAWCGRRLYIVDLKGLALDTPLPTPDGWTTMGDVRPGDQVLGRDGRPCTVTVKSATKRIGTYVVTFDDGAVVICDSEHLWETTTGQPRVARTTVKDIETIRDTLYSRQGQRDHRVVMPAPLDLPEAKVPIEPYLLGVWLGDGAVRGGTICKERDLFEVLASDDVPLGIEQVDARTGAITRTVLGLTGLLRDTNLLHNKHIPVGYLRGSHEQRLRLLQGLMDTDGTWNRPRRTAVFNTVNEELARQVEELLLTLGQRPHVASFTAQGFGLAVRAWAVEFTPVDLVPFRLPRKAALTLASTKRTTMARRRVITAVEPGPDVETACIAVDSPDSMYLCGRRMVPTHNTGRVDEYTELGIAMQLGTYANSDYYDLDTGERIPQDDICRCRAIVVHLPALTGEATTEWSDIFTGWQVTTEVARRVRAARNLKGLSVPFVPTADLMILIREADSRPTMNAIYATHRGIWTDEHTEAATIRLRQLNA